MQASKGKRQVSIDSGRNVASKPRAFLLLAVALATADLLWHVRPAPPGAASAPDSAIVTGCAWLAWGLAGYLAVAVAATSLSHVMSPAGAQRWLVRLAPNLLRWLVELALTASLTAGVLGSGAVASGAPRTPVSHARGVAPGAPGSALDWPGLPVASTHAASQRPPQKPAPAPPSHAVRRHPDPGLVSGGRVVPSLPASRALGAQVVVRRGDSLWSIASRTLAPHPSAAAVTAAWHRWYAANRGVIGSDPSLIRPGQQACAGSAPAHHRHRHPGRTP